LPRVERIAATTLSSTALIWSGLRRARRPDFLGFAGDEPRGRPGPRRGAPLSARRSCRLAPLMARSTLSAKVVARSFRVVRRDDIGGDSTTSHAPSGRE